MAPEEGPRPNSANWVAAVIRDKCTGMEAPCVPSIVRVPLTPDGTAPNGATLAVTQSNSGRYFAFISRASNLVPDDRNQFADVFISDACFDSASCIPSTWRISRAKSGLESDADSTELAFSTNGKVAAFTTAATTLDPEDTNGVEDVYLYVRKN